MVDAEIDAGLKSGVYFKGKLYVAQHKTNEGYIKMTDTGKYNRIIIPDKRSMNRAIFGDTVAGIVCYCINGKWHCIIKSMKITLLLGMLLVL